MMFSPQAYENSAPEGIGVLEVRGDGNAPEGEPRRFVPLKRTELRGEVVGPLASLRLVQLYGYSREQCGQVLEAVYRFPLPGDAAVTAVRVRFGAVEIRTALKERAAAEAEYDEAKRRGRQAALMSRESPDVFTLQVAGIEPDQDVTVETEYVQLARTEGAGWSLRVPLTTAPRYVRGDEAAARHAQGQPLDLLRDPSHRFSMELRLFGAGEVSSPTHPLAVSAEDDGVRVALREGEVVPDRDCVLTWQPRQEQDRPQFHVWLHDDRDAGQVYFLALVAPPAVPGPGAGLAREVILLVDHSGSMEGPKWAAADWAVTKFLSELGEPDAFDLGLFHNTTRWFSPAPRHAAGDVVQEAVQFLEAHTDSGGTELGVALEQALHLERAAGAAARHVLVITDAQVTDAGRVLRLADEEARRDDRRRISALCIDAAPNSFLALELAERGGGIARFLTSDPEQEDISTALDEVLADWAQPVLAWLQLEIDRPQAQAAGRAALGGGDEGPVRIDLGDLPTGRSLWVVGRVPRGEEDELTFRVVAPGGREVKARRLDLEAGGHERPAIRALFAARRIAALEYLVHAGYGAPDMADALRRLGYDADALLAGTASAAPKLYAENTRADSETALHGLLVAESLSSGLISSETAFVAVREEGGKPVEGTVVVENALPAGWSERFVGAMSAPGPMRAAFLAAPSAGPAAAAPMRHQLRHTLVGSAGDSSLQLPVAAAPAAGSPVPAAQDEVLFAGVPRFEGETAVLFDTARAEDAGKLPDSATLTRLRLRFPAGAPDPRRIDPGLCLLLFVEDLAAPRARVRIADLVRVPPPPASRVPGRVMGGERPLNLRRRAGQRVRIELADPSGAWASGGPAIEVALGSGH